LLTDSSESRKSTSDTTEEGGGDTNSFRIEIKDSINVGKNVVKSLGSLSDKSDGNGINSGDFPTFSGSDDGKLVSAWVGVELKLEGTLIEEDGKVSD